MQRIKQLPELSCEHSFFSEADEFLKTVSPGTYILMAIDVEHFRMFNRIFGREEGNNLLKAIAESIENVTHDIKDVFAAYMRGDDFCVIMPDDSDLLDTLGSKIDSSLDKYKSEMDIRVLFGIYPVEDMSLSAEAMYDRAISAIDPSVLNYKDCVYRYNPRIESKVEEELKLIAEVKEGLKRGDFTFFIQPQCDLMTGKIVGGEALARWNHPQKGWISPGVFIPVIEKNGLVAELDRYIWRAVCSWFRSWIDRGYNPVPISVNVSRIDILSMNVPEYLENLIKEYNIPPKLLKVEITESAYLESDDFINETVNKLRKSGFIVMLDDFGSGYSSLNVLNNIKVDVIKLDMRFLDIDKNDIDKGIGILGSVINMVRMLGLPIIAEGVETQEQEDFLGKMGCRYMQGYFYYKPLPIEQIENIISDERKLDFAGLSCNQLEAMHVREFLDSNLFDDRMVNNMLGAVAFYEVCDGKIEITRVNEQYYQLTGISVADGQRRKMWNHVRDDDRQLMQATFDNAYADKDNGASANLHYMRVDGTALYVHIRLFFLREKDGRKIFYGSLTDMTMMEADARRNAVETTVEELTQKQQSRLEQYYGSIPYGYAVAKVVLDDSDMPKDYEIVYINRELGKVCGNKIARFRQLILQIFKDNYEEFMTKIYRAAYFGEQSDCYSYNPNSNNYLQITFYQYENGYVSCILRDVTHVHIYENALNSIMSSYREVYFIHLQNNYCRMLYPDENSILERGNYEAVIDRHFYSGKISSNNERRVRKFLSLANLKTELATNDTIEYRYLRLAPDGYEEWCLTSITVGERENDIPITAVLMIRSIENLMQEDQEKRLKNLAQTLAYMEEGFFIYKASEDNKILYASPKALQIFGYDSFEEFMESIQGTFNGIVHEDDLKRVQFEIDEQIKMSGTNTDYIQYRIVRKDGAVRWVDDWGRLEEHGFSGEKDVFYVFIQDITDSITEQQKQKLLTQNRYY